MEAKRFDQSYTTVIIYKKKMKLLEKVQGED